MKEVHKENETLTEELSELDGSDEFSTANLPSRKEIHGKKKQKTKVKIKFPFVKMLALFFVIILGTVWAVATQMTKDVDSAKSSSEKESEYEESIGEISGFDDEEEEKEKENEKENEEVTKEEEASEETKEVDAENKQQEPVEEEKVTEETKVTTTETAGTAESKEQITDSKEQTESAPTKNNGVTEHVVQSNENLFRIALKYYSSAEGVEIIKQYNGLSSNEITVGQVLKIPPR